MVYRAAIIGCGMIGSEFDDDPRVNGIYSHAGAYASCPETSLVAICDSDANKVEHCGQRWNVPARYRDSKQMLAEQRLDIVSICTPDETHYDLICAAIATPGVRAVLAEKPLSLELDQTRQVVGLANARGIVLAVNYSRRYAPSHIRLKEFLSSGGIGEIQTVSGFYTKGLLHNGTHWFDLARFLVGEVVRVWGVDVRKENSLDPTLDAFLDFECGASAYLHGCDKTAFSLFEMDLIGTNGRVRVIESGQTIEFFTVVDDSRFTGYKSLMEKNKISDGLHNELLYVVEDVVRCLNESGQPRCSGADGVETLRIALAVRESAQSGRFVTLSYD
jgi:predicted dehydrogenase